MAVRNSSEVRVYIGGYDISTAMLTARAILGVSVLDKTGLGDVAETITAGNRADGFEVDGLFDDAARSVDAMFGSLVGSGVGDVASLVIGTGTGARVYSGSAGVIGAAIGGRNNELVRATVTVKPDTTLIPAKHFGVLTTKTAGANSGSLDDTTGTSGTGYWISHVTQMSGTLGTLSVNLEHSTDGTVFTNKETHNYTAAGSTITTITGSLNRYVRMSSGTTTATGTFSYFGAYKRP